MTSACLPPLGGHPLQGQLPGVYLGKGTPSEGFPGLKVPICLCSAHSVVITSLASGRADIASGLRRLLDTACFPLATLLLYLLP